MAGHKLAFSAEADAGEPRFFAAANLDGGGIGHGFFMRIGGVSRGLYASLNCGRGSKDDTNRVCENRLRVAAILGVEAGRLIGPRQIHSADAVIVTSASSLESVPGADAVVTAVPGLALSVLTADCAPVLMADAGAGVIAAVHAGWKGAKGGVIESAVAAMESLGADASRIAAAIGPAIGQASYEVGPDFQAAFISGDRGNEQYFKQQPDGRPHFNLPVYVKDRLKRRGVTNIEDIGVCTYENESILFSFRRSCHRVEPDYGRQISAILIR